VFLSAKPSSAKLPWKWVNLLALPRVNTRLSTEIEHRQDWSTRASFSWHPPRADAEKTGDRRGVY